MKPADYLAKMQKARETLLEIEGFSFTVRRPTDVETSDIRGALDQKSAKESSRVILRYVVGWSGVKESDLFPGGDPVPAEFDPDVCFEWLSDRMEFIGKITEHLIGEINRFHEKTEVAEKN